MTSERKQEIEKIKNLPSILDAAVKGLNDTQLDTPYRAGSWTVRQVVHHLADSHMNAFVRMKLVLTEDHPQLKPYDQDLWAMTADSARLPVAASLSIVRGLHERWVTLLESIPESAWARAGYHPEHGDITLERILKIYSAHGAQHVETIRTLRTQKGW